MGAGASVDEREDGGGVMQLLGLKPKELAARALAEGKDPVVADIIRKHKLTAAKAVDLDEEDVDKYGLAQRDRLKFEAALEQIKFALDTGRSRQRLAELATRFGGVRQLFAQLELTRKRSMSLAKFSDALLRLKLHGEFPPAEQEMLFRALHADTTTEMFFSQIVAVEELVAWLEACPRKGDAGYVPADYVDPPELQEVTAEAPRVDAARISRVSKPVGEGSFGSTVVSVAHWKQSWKKKKQKVALKRAIDPKEKVVELEASLQDLDEVVALEPRNNVAVVKRNAVAKALEKAKALVREALQQAPGTDIVPAELFALQASPNPFMQKFFGVTSVGGELNVIMEAALCPLMVAMRKGLGKDPLAIVRAARDIALGLEFLHQKEMPHLALHPNNVLLNQEGLEFLHKKKGRRDTSDDVAMVLKHAREVGSALHFQLTDHGGGIARAASRAKASRYAAPELLCGYAGVEWESFDIALEKKCDAWSYGSVLLEMLTGKAPWSSLEDEELADKAKRGMPPPLPDELDGDGHAELLSKAREFLVVNPSARPHFDEKLGADLDLLLLKAAVKAEPAKADFTSTVNESIQKIKMKKLIEHEMQKDKDAYTRAWEACERGVTPYVVANLKADCADLQEYFKPPTKEDVRQPVPVKTAKELVAVASAANATFHATLRPLVEEAGGTYKEGPIKLEKRVRAKAHEDYHDDVARVVDVVRATAEFKGEKALVLLGKAAAGLFVLGLEGKIERLSGNPEHADEVDELKEKLISQRQAYKQSFQEEVQARSGGRLVIIRVKDRINNPTKDSGYRDVMMNVEIDNHVGELQLSLAPLLDVKSSGHAIYSLTRAQGGYDTILDVLGLSDPPDIALHPACKEGNADVVRTWLNRGADFNCCCELEGYENKWPLFLACENGHAEVAQLLLNHEAEIERAREDGWTPLLVACEKGHVDAARVLLEMGAEVDRAEKDGFTPLYFACYHGHVDAVRLLLDNGAKVDRATNWGTPLSIARDKGHSSIVELIEDHMYPLHAAAKNGDVDALERLLAALPTESAGDESSDDGREDCRLKIDDSFSTLSDGEGTDATGTTSLLNAQGPRPSKAKGAGPRSEIDALRDGATPLWIACEKGQVDAARLLLDNGAGVDRADETGMTPLYIACWYGHVDVARLLLERDAEVDRAKNDGFTPLLLVCQEGHVDAALLLLGKGAEVDQAIEDGWTPLLIACFHGHVDVARLLLDKGAEVDRAMEDGRTPLFAACQAGQIDTARLLLEKGAAIDRANKNGETPLIIACEKGHVDTARLLLDRGAKFDRSHMDVACKGGHVDVAKLLMERGVRIDHVDPDGSTALHRACHTGDVTTAETFLKLGAADTINQKDKQGRTPLFVACERGTNDAARMLLREGAKVDEANNLGWTPLHIACKYGRVASARLLLDNGAEVDRGDQQTFTPLYNACVEGHVSAAKLLLERGADRSRVLGTEKREGADFPPAIDVLLADDAAPSGAMMVMAPS